MNPASTAQDLVEDTAESSVGSVSAVISYWPTAEGLLSPIWPRMTRSQGFLLSDKVKDRIGHFTSNTGPVDPRTWSAMNSRRQSVLSQTTTAISWGLAFFSVIASLTPQIPDFFSMHFFMFINYFLQMFGIVINGKRVFWVFPEKTRQMLKLWCPAHFWSFWAHSSCHMECALQEGKRESGCYRTRLSRYIHSNQLQVHLFSKLS